MPVVLHLLAELPSLRHGLVMVQREVADRLAAAPGSKIVRHPEREARLVRHAPGRPAGCRRACSGRCRTSTPDLSRSTATTRRPDADRLPTFEVVDAAFAQRRKTLRAALAGWAGGASVAADILVAAGVDPVSRGETLTVDEFAAIAAAGVTRRVIAPPPEPTIRPRAARALKRHEPHMAAPAPPRDSTAS